MIPLFAVLCDFAPLRFNSGSTIASADPPSTDPAAVPGHQDNRPYRWPIGNTGPVYCALSLGTLRHGRRLLGPMHGKSRAQGAKDVSGVVEKLTGFASRHPHRVSQHEYDCGYRECGNPEGIVVTFSKNHIVDSTVGGRRLRTFNQLFTKT